MVKNCGSLPILTLVALLLLSACRMSSDEVADAAVPGEALPTTTHPTSASIDRKTAIAIRVSKSSEATGSVENDVEMLRSLAETTLFKIGAEEGGDHEIFGAVAAAILMADGRVAILDENPAPIRVFAPDGSPLYSIGRPGLGPGEFRAPLTMDVAENQALIVVDRDRRVSTYVDTTLVATATLSVNPNGACAGGTLLFVSALDIEASTSIQRYDLETDGATGFGEPYPEGPPLTRDALTGGAIACSKGRDHVFAIDTYLPFVMSYNRDGQLRWTAQIEDFVPRNIESGKRDDGRPYVRYTYLDDYMANLVALSSGNVLVQVAHSTMQSSQQRKPYDTITTYVLDHRTGHGAFAGDDIPWVEYASANRILTLRQSPYPIVTVHEH